MALELMSMRKDREEIYALRRDFDSQEAVWHNRTSTKEGWAAGRGLRPCVRWQCSTCGLELIQYVNCSSMR